MINKQLKIDLKTERLHLQPLNESDANFIQELVNTEGWLKFIGNRNVNNQSDAIAYIHKINANENVSYWVVNPIENKQPIGIVTLIKRDYLDNHDIGFAFLPNAQSKGYAFEAAQSVLEYLESNKYLDKILATTIPKNTSSIKLLNKLGLNFEKEINVAGEVLHVYHANLKS
jgi:[ribosomal protein S5]-alanine N-acetyltransferase